jgi:hypothetical protein
MRFPPSLLDEIRARLPVSQVVSRKVALKRAGREFKGLSPFKQERTPSFTVNDQKGFYHCFASGEHGDIFTFLVKTEGLSFPEAVERLAEEAGVPSQGHSARAEGASALLPFSRGHALLREKPPGPEARRYLARAWRPSPIPWLCAGRPALRTPRQGASTARDGPRHADMGDDIPLPTIASATASFPDHRPGGRATPSAAARSIPTRRPNI